MKLKIVVNNICQEELALVDINNKKVLIKGDYYHDKIKEYINGYLKGLADSGIHYELLGRIYADNENNKELFELCKFDTTI